ncbi:SulP family inorganic anion transporter, partial [Azotobacter chroococcum]|nr:SulP family inorganic anion transporter [Azotobacter chroococcum]
MFNVRSDVLAGLVVALALIPEAIAFSIIAGVDLRRHRRRAGVHP